MRWKLETPFDASRMAVCRKVLDMGQLNGGSCIGAVDQGRESGQQGLHDRAGPTD
jgi:hypothetical protein